MLRHIMALLAEPGRADLQQLRILGAVRVMARRAIFHHRRMLPQERPAPFRMTLVTGLIHRGFDQQLRIGSAVRIVAIRARHLSFSKRHVRRALQLRPAHRVALEADLHLGLFDECLIGGQRLHKAAPRNGRLHDLVTRHAGHPSGLVRAPLPEHPRALFMALQAGSVELFGRKVGLLGKTRNTFLRTAALHMRARRPVTRFATQSLLVVARILQENFSHDGCGEARDLFRMTELAGLDPAHVFLLGSFPSGEGRKEEKRKR